MLIDKLGAFASHASNSGRKILFVKPLKVEEVKANIARLDKGKTSCMNICVKPEFKAFSREQTHTEFVPTCQHCGIVSHIRQNCFKLKSQRPWNKKVAHKKEKGRVKSCLSISKYMYIPPHMRQGSPKFVPTCHHCGKVGYIQPNYFKFNPVSIRVRIPILLKVLRGYAY
jgi:hypothetical protein